MVLFLLLLSFPVLFTVPFFFHGSLLLFFLQLFDVFIPFLNLLLLGQARRVPGFVLFLETGGNIRFPYVFRGCAFPCNDIGGAASLFQ